ncbi:MAG TPA: porin [Gallionella sp.]|nr:porin [Gallionella sp.]
MSKQLNLVAYKAIAVFLLTCFAAPAWADASMEDRLKAMEQRLDSLEQENLTLKRQLQTTDQKVEVTGEQIDKIATQGVPSKAAWAEKTQFGGYGEMSLNQLHNGGPSGNVNQIDFTRFVLFTGHEFNDQLSFRSELEVEHAHLEGNKGELEVEQAYLNYNFNDRLSGRAGIILVPVGILNETHEPPTFYGVDRNPVETNIIPTTWFESGAGLTTHLGSGFTVDSTVTTGFKADAADNYGVREARQEQFQGTLARNPAYTARLKWAGIPGVELASTVQYQADITQGLDATAGGAILLETHAVLNRGPFALKALYANWNLKGSGPASVGANKQNGWYVEPAYKFSEQWGVFARYNRWDNQAGDVIDSRFSQSNLGVNYWPHPDVVVKFDVQNQKSPAGQDAFNGFNVGLGYQF